MATNPLLEAAQRRDALVAQIPTGGQRQAPAADGSQSNPLNNDFGRNLAALPSAGGIPGAALRGTGLVARAFGASQPAMSGLGQVAQAAAPYAPVAAGGAALASAASADSPAAPRAPAVPPMPSNPFVQAASASSGQATPAAPGSPPAPPAAPNSAVTRTGNSYSGMNVTGDISVNGAAPRGSVGTLPAGAAPPGMGSNPFLQAAGITLGGGGRPGFSVMDSPLVARAFGDGQPVMTTSQVNVQNWDAANGLAAQNNLESMARLRASGQIAAPAPGRSMSMSGSTFGFRRAPSVVGSEIAGQRAFDYATGNDPASRKRAGSIYEAMLQQQAETQRTAMRTGVDQQRLDMDRETQGFTNRRMGLVEYMRNQVAQEQDPTKRRGLVQYMRDVEGSTQQADPYLVVAGGQQVDPTSGRAYNTPSTVFNRSTGQFVQQPGQGGQQVPSGMARQVGTSGGKPVYEDAAGNRFIGG